MQTQSRCFICNEIRNTIPISLWSKQKKGVYATFPICSFACFKKLIYEHYEAQKDFVENIKKNKEMKNETK